MDNLQDIGPQDRKRISLTQDHEIKWWTASLGISVKELNEAVLSVGNSAEKVKEYLKKNKGINLL